MKLTFLGAAHEVTGSCTLLETGGRYFLVDHGMEQGVNVFENAPLPVAPGEIDAVFLTHAHIDHAGLLPKLCKDGFHGKIYATEATDALCRIMLMDSANIQMSDAQWQTRKAERAGKPAIEPLYTTDDAAAALALLRPCAYGKTVRAAEGVRLRFTDVGHLLGSACVELWLTEDGVEKKVVFSGDVGNTGKPILRDPQTVDAADVLIVESTYGGRLHERTGDAVSALAGYIQRTFDRGGSVIIPAFAVGRTQELLYAIREIKQKKLVRGHDGFPVYLDSPLAEEATAVFLQCDPDFFDEPTRELLRQGVNPIWFPNLHLAPAVEQSRAINSDPRPKIILSASGMCDAGRIRHHLKHNLWKSENLVLLAGYQANGTLGRSLQEGVKAVRLFGEEVAVRAEIAMLHGASGHADQAGLLRWVEAIAPKPQFVFVNHGDEENCEAFRDLLTKEGYTAFAPYSGTVFDVAAGRLDYVAEPRRIEKTGSARKKEVYTLLVETARRLLALAVAFREQSNQRVRKFTADIQALLDKWSG